MIVVITSDGADAVRVQRALGLLERHLRQSGSRLPSVLREPVVHAAAAHSGPQRTTVGQDPTVDDDDPVLLLSYAAVAERLDAGERTVRRLVADGHLPVVTLGRRRYVRPADLEQFVAALPAATPRQNRKAPTHA